MKNGLETTIIHAPPAAARIASHAAAIACKERQAMQRMPANALTTLKNLFFSIQVSTDVLQASGLKTENMRHC